MASNRRRALAGFVFVAAAIGFFCYWTPGNDHYDRLARARQIAVFGDVPFRDFFDPGYFLTLYSSALLQRLLGDNLLGEAILNVGFMAAGTTIVFLLASRASGSTMWGLIVSGLVVLGEPRTYDYDKVLFYPLGLYGCWQYIDRPTARSVVLVAAIAVLGGLFRYDTAVYVTAAFLVAIVVRQWGTVTTTARHLGAFVLASLLFAAPALAFLQATAGLSDVFQQVTTYAVREGERSDIFTAPRFDIDWSAPIVQVTHENDRFSYWNDVYWFQGFQREGNAAAGLYYLAIGLPILATGLMLLRKDNRKRPVLAMVLSLAVMAELIAALILRNPITARIGAVMPLALIAMGFIIGEWVYWLARAGQLRPTASVAVRLVTAATGATACLLTFSCIWALVWYPPKSNVQFTRRVREIAQVPLPLTMLPKNAYEGMVDYIRACTKPSDRLFEPWFAAELYFFSERGFAAGLPEVFGDHWSELSYQRRSIRLLEQQSVPIIFNDRQELSRSYEFLWEFIQQHYQLARTVSIGQDSPTFEIWVKKGLPIDRVYGPLALPCYTQSPESRYRLALGDAPPKV